MSGDCEKCGNHPLSECDCAIYDEMNDRWVEFLSSSERKVKFVTYVEKKEWVNVKDKAPNCKNVLAICVSDKSAFYNMRHDGWFRDTIYSCRMNGNEFVIESHGPILPATHWMPIPDQPKDK